MQGVAAKNDASDDLSRARASVTGQTTIAAATATTSLPNGSIVTALFAGALFLSAFLLFVLEPMVATSILPTLGGTPMVWNTRLRGSEVVDLVEAEAARDDRFKWALEDLDRCEGFAAGFHIYAPDEAWAEDARELLEAIDAILPEQSRIVLLADRVHTGEPFLACLDELQWY
jgi:hypothetical protein